MEQQGGAAYLEPTWNSGIKMWWWITWRTFLVAGVGGLIIGVVLGFIQEALGFPVEAIMVINNLVGLVWGIGVGVFFFMKLLEADFSDFSLRIFPAGSQLESGGVLDTDWNKGLKAWWFITWRLFLSALIGGILIGLVFGFIFTAIGFPPEAAVVFQALLIIALIIGVSAFFYRQLAQANFSDFSIRMVPK